jgi:hypothetical protein
MKALEMPTDEQVDLASEGFRLLAEPTRIKILWALYSATDDHVARLLAEALYHADHQISALPKYRSAPGRRRRARHP